MSRYPAKRLNRRTLLRGATAAGTVAIGLPLLEAMMPSKASAQDGTPPKRIVFWFTANGTYQSIWSPGGAILNLAGHPIHDPLTPLQSKLLFLDGVNDEQGNNSIGDGHQTGMACLLTNQPILPGNLFCEGNCDPGMEQYVGWGGGISIDQHLANEIESDVITKFKSLDLGVQVRSHTVWSRMSYAAPDQPIQHREDPNQNFVDFFSDLTADPFQLALLRKKRKSVLDAVMGDYSALNIRLGVDDRLKLDNHLESIRSIERRLDANTTFGAACQEPIITAPGPNDYDQNDFFPQTGKAQMDLLVMALACDMTRVASIQWSRAVSNVTFSWLTPALTEGHHDISHYDLATDTYAQDALRRINHWYTEQFAYFLTAMDSIDEGTGTMLDNSVVVWVNELGQGDSHTRDEIPFILAGGCKGYFQTGRSLDLGGEPHGKLLVSLCHAMDKPVATFGNAQYSQGPLAGLT